VGQVANVSATPELFDSEIVDELLKVKEREVIKSLIL